MPADTAKLSFFLEAIPKLEKVNINRAYARLQSTRVASSRAEVSSRAAVAEPIKTLVDLNRRCVAQLDWMMQGRNYAP